MQNPIRRNDVVEVLNLPEVRRSASRNVSFAAKYIELLHAETAILVGERRGGLIFVGVCTSICPLCN